MSSLPSTFADLLAPLSEDAFFSDYFQKKPLHVRGDPGRFDSLMSWEKMNQVLELQGIWTGRMLQMALNRKQIPPERYCVRGATVEGERLMADPARVSALLAEGASLVANTMDGLTPELNQIAGILEQTFTATAQGNLYCSSRERQAFDTHYDTHDVFALHTTGEKVWRIYAARLASPMTHPAVADPGPHMAERAREKLLMEVTLRPGDLLYIPRGQYHDAMAKSDACIHVAFGVVPMRGSDLFAELENIAVADPYFRADLPRTPDDQGRAAFQAYLKEFAERVGVMAQDPEGVDRLLKAQADRIRARDAYTIPQIPRSPAYRVTAPGLKVTRAGGQMGLTDGTQATALPPGTGNFVTWILARGQFLEAEALAEFRHWAPGRVREMLGQLEQMNVIAKD